MTNKQNILIVGAGLSGVTVARHLAEADYNVTVIDIRDHIAGNAFDYTSPEGIRIHRYGPHIFHTSNKAVFDWLSRFTEWLPYRHRVRALLADGREVVMPPNLETRDMVGEENLIDVLFRPYTRKMWGCEIEELDPSILSRVPVRDDLSDAYFPNDEFQFMPKDGYTALVERILDHPNITVQLSKPFEKSMENDFDHVFNSMPIDEYFEFSKGELPYRSIRFTTLTLPYPSINSVATVNFTHDGPHTRVTEWKKFPGHGDNLTQTVLTFEEPCDYRDNNHERYYPVKDRSGKNREIYEAYKALVPENVTFIGRCGMYVYLDMHQAISSAMAIARRHLEGES